MDASAVLEALDREDLRDLRVMLTTNGHAFEQRIRNEYLQRPDAEGAFGCDTQEALEAAIADEKRMVEAAAKWRSLTERERQTVQAVTDIIYGQGQGEELAF